MSAESVDLSLEGQALLLKATESSSGRASHSLLHGDHQRVVLIALTAGSELAEHEAPLAATLHVLSGKCRLTDEEEEWLLSAGEMVPIPPLRHSVTSLEDCVFLLTVSL